MKDELDLNIEAFEAQKEELLRYYPDKWVIFHNTQFEGSFDTFENAAKSALQRFGRGPFLIRQVTLGQNTYKASCSISSKTINSTLRYWAGIYSFD